MKKVFLLQVLNLLVACFFFQFSYGQSTETITLKPGENLFEKYPNEVYAYSQFRSGKVYYTNGDSAGGRMNYNHLMSAFEFISNRDTLVFLPETEIRYIDISGDIYYYNKPDYVRFIAGSSVCKLAFKTTLKFADVKKIGAFGVPSNTLSIDSYNELRADQVHKLIHNEEVVFKKETILYMGNEKNVFSPASKKNILKLFPSKKKSIEEYLSGHSIDFQNEKNLLDLLNFIQNIK